MLVHFLVERVFLQFKICMWVKKLMCLNSDMVNYVEYSCHENPRKNMLC